MSSFFHLPSFQAACHVLELEFSVLLGVCQCYPLTAECSYSFGEGGGARATMKVAFHALWFTPFVSSFRQLHLLLLTYSPGREGQTLPFFFIS